MNYDRDENVRENVRGIARDPEPKEGLSLHPRFHEALQSRTSASSSLTARASFCSSTGKINTRR